LIGTPSFTEKSNNPTIWRPRRPFIMISLGQNTLATAIGFHHTNQKTAIQRFGESD
jgi:hypothetical protein